MRMRWVGAVATVVVLAAGCTSSGGSGGGPSVPASGPTVSGPVSAPGSATSASSSASSSAPSVAASAPRNAPPITPTTRAALRAFVLAGTRVTATDYAYSADAAGEPLARNRFGNRTFRTPSGNIACDLRPAGRGTVDQAVCWVQALAHPPARPANCTLDWAAGVLEVTAGGVQLGECLGGAPFSRYANELPYGSTLVVGGVGCRSDARFVACAYLADGSGFRADRSELVAVRA